MALDLSILRSFPIVRVKLFHTFFAGGNLRLMKDMEEKKEQGFTEDQLGGTQTRGVIWLLYTRMGTIPFPLVYPYFQGLALFLR